MEIGDCRALGKYLSSVLNVSATYSKLMQGFTTEMFAEKFRSLDTRRTERPVTHD